MWTKLPPPDFKSIDNQLDMCLLVAMHPHLGERVLTWGNVSSLGVTRSHLGATRPRVGIVKLGLDAPTWQYNTMMRVGRVLYLLAKASSLVKQMPTRGRVAPR